MSPRANTVLGAIVTLFASVACNPYDPDLGATPFRCGTSEPRCPEGYGAVTVPAPILCECQEAAEGNTPDAGGDGAFTCNADPNEAPDGNETIGQATITSIGPGSSAFVSTGLAVCPTSDIDIYSMQITQAGMMIEVRIPHDSTQGMLALDLLNSGGTSVASGTQQAAQLRALYTAPTSGTYFFRVKAGAAGAQNNYSINVSITGP